MKKQKKQRLGPEEQIQTDDLRKKHFSSCLFYFISFLLYFFFIPVEKQSQRELVFLLSAG